MALLLQGLLRACPLPATVRCLLPLSATAPSHQQLQQRAFRPKFKCRKARHQYKLSLVYVKGRPSEHPVQRVDNLYSGKAGLPLLPISGTGSVYDTEIKRCTPIRDPNLPKARPFEPQKECLKWTDWRMLRDVNRRLLTAELHPLRKNLISIKRSWTLPVELAEEAYRDLAHKLPAKAAPSGTANRCAITSRGRGRFRMFRLSRMMFRQFADHNQLSGVMKSMWGP